MGKFGKYIGLIGAGLAAIGYVGWRMLKKTTGLTGHEPETTEAVPEPAEAPETATVTFTPAPEIATGKRKPVQQESSGKAAPSKKPRAIPEAEKTSLLNGIAAALKDQNADEFTIRFGQSRQKGYRGYYISGMTDASVFVGWSKEYEGVYGMTPFWIELDEAATARFKESGGLERKADMYPHPGSAERLLIAIPREQAKKPEEAASAVLEIARATLV